jgi:transposase
LFLHDNATIHHAKILKQWANTYNILLIFNPPYTPQFNPIELAFSKIKTIFRTLSHSDIKTDILKAINSITQSDSPNYFNHALKIILTYKK